MGSEHFKELSEYFEILSELKVSYTEYHGEDTKLHEAGFRQATA
jgi:hypothetical protein